MNRKSKRTACGKDGDVYIQKEATICEVQGADGVAPNGGLLVVLTPVDIRSAGAAGTIENMGGFRTLQFSEDSFAIFHADRSCLDLLALTEQELIQLTSYPSLSTPNQERVLIVPTRFEFRFRVTRRRALYVDHDVKRFPLVNREKR